MVTDYIILLLIADVHTVVDATAPVIDDKYDTADTDIVVDVYIVVNPCRQH